MSVPPILIIDDDSSLRRVMQFALEEGGYACLTADSGEEGLLLFREHRPSILVTDLKMPGISGFEVLQSVLNEAPETLVIVVTAFGTIESAVEAMKAGAFDYLTKPFGNDELLLTVQKAHRFSGLKQENRQLRTRLASRKETGILTCSPSMERVIEQARQVAASDAGVLILGESGTGKELMARAIHEASPRSKKAFVALNCASIPQNLIESELFGHVKGAFTGAMRDRSGRFKQADGGTLFLDEIGEMPLESQGKLLRALQEQAFEPVGSSQTQKVDVRILAATNRDLSTDIHQGRFREDLYYRLNVVSIEIPPLRERKEDILLLTRHFLKLYAPEEEFKLADRLKQRLLHYRWHGNVRELENLCHRWSILCRGRIIDCEDLPSNLSNVTEPTDVSEGHLSEEPSFVLQLPQDGMALETIEKEAIRQALNQSGGNKTRAAVFLQIPRHVLLYRLEKYGMG